MVALTGFVINVLCQIFSARFFKNFGLLYSVFLGFFCGLVFLILAEFGMITRHLLGLEKDFVLCCVHLITYFALSYCYFHFINLGETARRIRILWELNQSGKGLSQEELLVRYNAREIIERRLARLIKNNQVIFKEGRYYIGKPHVLIMARVLVALKYLLLGKRSEFD